MASMQEDCHIAQWSTGLLAIKNMSSTTEGWSPISIFHPGIIYYAPSTTRSTTNQSYSTDPT